MRILAADTIERRVELAHLPEGFFALLAIVALLLVLATVVYLYRQEQRSGAGLRMRLFLGGLRCSVVVLLALVWLQPMLATYIHRKIEAATLVLVDGSASMSLKDRYPRSEDAQRVEKVIGGRIGAASRSEVTAGILESEKDPLLARLAGRNQVRVFRFGDKLTPLGQVQADGKLVSELSRPPSNNANPVGGISTCVVAGGTNHRSRPGDRRRPGGAQRDRVAGRRADRRSGGAVRRSLQPG